jgi:hypothetical protein
MPDAGLFIGGLRRPVSMLNGIPQGFDAHAVATVA